ncbi:MAG: excinuclease ABC subunit C [Saprospirales bacterium]|nr:MAG: excinuclease ABC subunit C [Saprospirales bacterium]
MKKRDYRQIADRIPTQPGVYQFLDIRGRMLYVGKARNLHKRVATYFGVGKNLPNKTRVMVKNADRLKFIVADSEHDALLLENTLIKEHQPRYNVMLKDGKTYTYICVKNERFPRVFFTRKVIKDGSTYFGPYTSKYRAKIVLEMIKNLFPLRTCKYNLSEENIEKGKFKICLEYHIGNCLGPCEGLEKEMDYNRKIDQVKNMLRGNFGEVVRHLKKELDQSVEDLNFEQAQEIKEKLDAFEAYQSKSTVVSPSIRDVDVFTFQSEEDRAYVNYLKIVDGAVINTHTVELKKNLNREPGDLLSFAAVNLRERFNSIAPEVVVPFKLNLPDESITVTVPSRGDKRKLLEMSNKNLRYFVFQKNQERKERQKKERSGMRIVRKLKEDLKMEEAPVHMECFDNSNLQGSNPVASCVVFKNGKPSKKDYRKYHIKTVIGPDDFASMKEVIERRYKRLRDEGEPLPQLVVIDGGKGQLNAAVKILRELGVNDRITTIGIAKRLEEIYFPGDPVPLYLDKRSESLKVLQFIRNEAHRFAINFHRDQRSAGLRVSALQDIPGIGPKTTDKLLRHFGSLKKMSNAPREEIVQQIGPSLAEKIYTFLHGKQEEE